jgi:mono/diheme cytochrome c family protein
MQSLRPLAIAALLCAACSSGDDRQLSELAREGEKVYQNVCIACHNGDPNLDGSLGPANAGASEELLEAKVVRGEYPPGYTPKRPDSHGMPHFAHLADDIPALAAYLREVKTSDPDPR